MTWVLAQVILLGIASIAVVPLLVLAIIYADGLIESAARAHRRLRKARQMVLPEPAGPPLEKIAIDLRRIGAARRGAQLGSLGYTILTTQYDKQLAHGCRALGVEHHLNDLCGFDLDVERARVETRLGDGGLIFIGSIVEQDVDG